MVWRFSAWLTVFVVCAAINVSATRAQTPHFAPGVLTEIPPDPQYEETYSGPMDLLDIVKGLPELEWKPNYTAQSRTIFARAKLVVMRRTVWNLSFAFKPLRMIEVDVPQPSGKMQRKRVWYMVYRVRYAGNDLEPLEEKDRFDRVTYKAGPVAHENRFFFPQFILESLDYAKAYQDRIIPAAKELIAKRELRGQPLFNTVEISQQPIPLSTVDAPHDVWGVATWEDIDPRIDFFSVYVGGLTNAYRPVNIPNAYKPNDPNGAGVQLLGKTLRLNYWRPGDTVDEHEEEIHYGVPVFVDAARQAAVLSKFGLKSRVDHLWVYR